MGYRIQYGQTAKKEIIEERTVSKKQNVMRYILITVIIAAVIASCTKIDAVRKFLLPGDPTVTQNALTAFAENVRAGEPVSQAITTFCREIIVGADIS